ncbi:lebercilin-like protein isoform X4 [Leptopilina boulardi]|nr:lebercilin-like protein isoform X4 [Leptopilina boulardi]XP_051166911.1 lebercilin-like protein isoform X4 [Leptopilina boulardi]
MLQIKALQNELTDAHYHLNELANENRLLKTLQTRQDSALRKYEGTNAELPRIINTHHEELRVLQTKYKKLKSQYRSNCELLKEKDVKIHIIQDQNKHLLKLSKDRNLEERESLQRKTSDLIFKIEQQDKTINTLNRKLAIETKHLKHQLHLEVIKHKETQKKLQETFNKLKSTEELLENKEKKLLHGKHFNLIRTMQNIKSTSHPNLDNNRLGNSDGDNFNTPKVSLNNLENKKDSLIIEDVEKFIQQLNLSKISNRMDSIATISQCHITEIIEHNKDNNYLTQESFERSNENKIVISKQDNGMDNNSYNMNDNYVNNEIKDSEISLITTTESVSSLQNNDSNSPRKEKLHLKYSISEESEPEDFADELNDEIKSEICNSVKTTNNTTETLVFQKKNNYDKERLLAAMKAIDDNENIE